MYICIFVCSQVRRVFCALMCHSGHAQLPCKTYTHIYICICHVSLAFPSVRPSASSRCILIVFPLRTSTTRARLEDCLVRLVHVHVLSYIMYHRASFPCPLLACARVMQLPSVDIHHHGRCVAASSTCSSCGDSTSHHDVTMAARSRTKNGGRRR